MAKTPSNPIADRTRSGSLIATLQARLADGALRVGELWVTSGGELCHHADRERKDLVVHTDPHDAIELARFDQEGIYRPLKSAPNLRRGWKLVLEGPAEILLALDFFYPAALGLAQALADGRLKPVDLRRNLERQSGMYAVVRKLSDEQALGLVDNLCRGNPGCQRRILWRVSPDCELSQNQRGKMEPDGEEIPLLCAEPCNLLVAAGRKVLKGPKG